MKGRKNELTQDLILSIIDIDRATGCWVCRHVNAHGYGYVRVNLKIWRAHRASWTVFRGFIPKNKRILHRCDNRPCCNPKHLYVGSDAQNIRDIYVRGRANPTQGNRHGRSKLTEETVIQIFQSVNNQGLTRTRVAELHHIDMSVVSRIVSGKTWAHLNLVPGAPSRYPRKYAERRAS